MPRSKPELSGARWRALVLAALTLAGCASTPPTPPPGPALWVIQDADSTIYLLGTIHALRPEDTWRTPMIMEAFAESEELVLEIAELDDRDFMTALVVEHGVDMEIDLSSRLPPDCRERLAPAAQDYDIDMRGVERLRPWVAALSFGQAPMARSGYDLSLGVDVQLKAAAAERAIPVSGLETAQDQIMSFATLSESLQLSLLCSVLESLPEVVPQLEQIRLAWLNGDMSVLDALLTEGFRTRYPEFYAAVIVRRNQVMAQALAERLNGSGNSFVAVGAAHLAGPDSVQAFLHQAGVDVERVNGR